MPYFAPIDVVIASARSRDWRAAAAGGGGGVGRVGEDWGERQEGGGDGGGGGGGGARTREFNGRAMCIKQKMSRGGLSRQEDQQVRGERLLAGGSLSLAPVWCLYEHP